MLLSFYDTYYRDDFIDEIFDENAVMTGNFPSLNTINESPGVRNIDYDINYQSDYLSFLGNNCDSLNNYFSFILNGTDSNGDYYYLKYFDYYLMNYAYYHNYWPGVFMNNIGMTDYQLANTLAYYLSNNRNYENDVIIFERHDNNIEYYIRSMISDGYPVIVGLENNNFEGHYVVAYDYDSATNVIYANFGYGIGSTHIALNDASQGYTRVTTAISIRVSSFYDHLDSNNYYNSTTDYYFCACDFINYLGHFHSYDYIYNDYGSNHRGYCTCGAYSEFNHDYCNCEYYSMMKHKKTCGCGHYYYENHYFILVFVGLLQYRYCSECGYMYLYNGPGVIEAINNLLGG